MTYNDQVAQHDAVLMAEAGAGQDGGTQSRILDVNGQTGRHQGGITRGQGDWRIQQRTQIHTGRARCGVGGQRVLGTDTGIQNLQFNLCCHESFFQLELVSAPLLHGKAGRHESCVIGTLSAGSGAQSGR